MATFRFNLQAVLRQRERVEQERQRDFAVVQREYAALEAELRAMDDAVKAATSDLKDNHLVGRINVEYLAAHRRFTLAMQRKAVEHAERMSAVRQRLDVARTALVEAAKHRKGMETLREHRLDDWRAEENRLEAAATDEVAQQIGVRLVRAATEPPTVPAAPRPPSVAAATNGSGSTPPTTDNTSVGARRKDAP
ncbi:MAG: hypothetical protein JWO31_1684 [Phycisphaerales bacterium]|nr:hypothetical protein [Phycisphaerales bacterium]